MLLIVTDIVDFIVLKDAFIVVEFTYNAWLLSSENYTKLKINFPTKICDERAHMVSGCHILKDQWTLRDRCLLIEVKILLFLVNKMSLIFLRRFVSST